MRVRLTAEGALREWPSRPPVHGQLAASLRDLRKITTVVSQGAHPATSFDRHNLVNRQLKPTCKKLGLTGVSWHWLRHANATLLDSVGTPLGTVQVLLGHSSSEITRGGCFSPRVQRLPNYSIAALRRTCRRENLVPLGIQSLTLKPELPMCPPEKKGRKLALGVRQDTFSCPV